MTTVQQSEQERLTSQQTISLISSSRGSNTVRTGILSNLRAGRSGAQIPRLRAFLHGHPHVAHAQTRSAEDVLQALADLAEREVDLLMIYGGDGTLQHVLTELLKHRPFGDRLPMIAPLRGGSTNMTALDLGAHRNPIKGVAGVLRAIDEDRLHERVCERHVQHVSSKQGDLDQYGMFFGSGTVYRAIEQVKRIFPTGGATQGSFGSALITSRLIFKRMLRKHSNGMATTDRFRIHLDGTPTDDEDYNIVMTSTLRRLISGVRPFWGTEAAPVRFTAVAARAEGFGLAVPNLLRGKPNGRITVEKGYRSHNIHEAQLCLDCGFTIDGELHAPEPGRTLIITATDRLKFVRA